MSVKLMMMLVCSLSLIGNPVQVEAETVVEMGLPIETDGEFKSYMSYTAITDEDSMQYKMQEGAWTDENYNKINTNSNICVKQF